MKKKKVIKFFILILLLSLIVFFTSKNTEESINRLKTKGICVNGLIYKSSGFKGSSFLDFKFIDLNNKEKFGSFKSFFKSDNVFIGKKFPVLYNPQDPSEYEMLITKDQYEIYSIPYPDSLSWVNEYVYPF